MIEASGVTVADQDDECDSRFENTKKAAIVTATTMTKPFINMATLVVVRSLVH